MKFCFFLAFNLLSWLLYNNRLPCKLNINIVCSPNSPIYKPKLFIVIAVYNYNLLYNWQFLKQQRKLPREGYAPFPRVPPKGSLIHPLPFYTISSINKSTKILCTMNLCAVQKHIFPGYRPEGTHKTTQVSASPNGIGNITSSSTLGFFFMHL